MRTKQLLTISAILFCNIIYGQVLTVKEVFQEKTNWCWAGVSECLLNYYYHPYSQCEIAEYARGRVTWTNYGIYSCCSNIASACNQGNQAWGYDGSVQDILQHFGNIKNVGYNRELTKAEIIKEISSCRPFAFAYEWTEGGGHIMVGYGINGDYINYMDPWMGEGYKIVRYDWMKKSSNHVWNITNLITTNAMLPEKANKPVGTTSFLQNPETSTYTTNRIREATEYKWTLTPENAGTIIANDTLITIDYNDNYIGKVSLKVEGKNNCIVSVADTLNISINPYPPTISEQGTILTSTSTEGNQWYWEDIPISLANKQTFKPKKNGNYKCVVTINTCSSEPSNSINIQSINSATFADLSPLNIYPNPAVDKIRVSITEPFTETFTVEMFDISGNKVQSNEYDKNIDELEIDLRTQLKGLYFVHIYSNDRSMMSKIIKD